MNYDKHLSPTDVILKYIYQTTHRSGMRNALAKAGPLIGQKKSFRVMEKSMNNKTKPKFNAYTGLPQDHDDHLSTADLGIEFVYFDADENPESVQTIPLGKFVSDTPLSSEEYFMTRSLVAAQATK